MTEDEADRVLDYLAEMWPGVRWEPSQRGNWSQKLQRHDFAAARVAAKQLADTSPRLPSWHELNVAIRAEERRTLTSTFPTDPEDGPPASDDTRRRCMAEARAALAGDHRA